MKFVYQARTKKGETQTGNIEASSREAALTLLQKHNLYVTILEEVGAQPFYVKRIKFFEKISKKDLVIFFRQLAIMFKSKISLVEALRTLSLQIKKPELKETILKLSEEVEAGSSFSKALSKHPKTFSPFYIAIIKAGEVSGNLSESLSGLAEHLEREYHLTSKMKGAMYYPLLVLAVIFLILGMLFFFVIPQLASVLESTGQPLPTVTKFVIGLSGFLAKFWLPLFLFAFLLFFSLFRYYQTEKGKGFFDKLFLKVPIIGPFLKMIYLSRLAENLSTLISGGLPIIQSLTVTADILDNSCYKEALFKTKEGVKKGEKISSALINFTDIFPPVFVQIVLIGEKTGTLDKSLIYLSDFYKKEIDTTIDSLLSILEPFLIIFLGIVVAVLMLSLLVPLYQMVTF